MIEAGVKSRKALTHTCGGIFIEPLREPEKIDPNRPYTYEEWKRQLIITTKHLVPNVEFKINDEEARKCFESGMSVYQTFRENFRMS